MDVEFSIIIEFGGTIPFHSSTVYVKVQLNKTAVVVWYVAAVEDDDKREKERTIS